MVNNRFNLCKKSLAFMWYSRRKLSRIRDKRGCDSKIHLVVNGYILLLPVDHGADYKEAMLLIDNIDAKLILVDRAYNTDKLFLILISKI